MYHQTFKRPLFQTVKGRIQLITVTFSLVVAVILATCSVSFFQTYARHNVVQSTEFNLQLVSSTVGGNLSAAEQLSERCALNVLVSKWLTNTPRSSQTTLANLLFSAKGTHQQPHWAAHSAACSGG